MRRLFHITAATLLISASALFSAAPLPEKILAEAARYTVKVKSIGDIGLNKDDGGSGEGTGFLIDRKRGWILTNAHVASRSPAEIEVSFKGGPLIKARRIHVDALIDLAVLEVPVKEIPDKALEAQLDCDALPAAGTSVFAYGHPWGLSYTASRGIVSGVSWLYPREHIQTDAAINSGNSGGPLISLSDGKVIGISALTYKDTEDDNATAIGLAEPMPPICHLVMLLRAQRDARLRMLPFPLATSDEDLRPRIARVFDVSAAFQPGDIIVKVNGAGPVRSLPDLLDRLRGLDGDVALTIERKGKSLVLETRLLVKPDLLKVRAINIAGLVLTEPWRLDDQELNPEHNLVVDWIQDNQVAGLTNAQMADTVVSIDGRGFHSLDELYAYLAVLPKDAEVELILYGQSDASEFFREYRHIVLPRADMEMIEVER